MCKTTWYWFVWSRVVAGRPICLLGLYKPPHFSLFYYTSATNVGIDIYLQDPTLYK